MAKQAVASNTTFRMPLPRVLYPVTRELVERAIEAHQAAMQGLIGFLDEVDGDPELEDDGDREPECDSGDASAFSWFSDRVRDRKPPHVRRSNER